MIDRGSSSGRTSGFGPEGEGSIPSLRTTDDGIECRITSYAFVPRRPRPPRVIIGGDTYVFPEGTTNAEAQSVLDEAWRMHLESIA